MRSWSKCVIFSREYKIFQQRSGRERPERQGILIVGDRNALLGGKGLNPAPRDLMQLPTLGLPLLGAWLWPWP